MRRHEMRTRGGKVWEGEASAWGVRACVLRHGHGWGARLRARVRRGARSRKLGSAAQCERGGRRREAVICPRPCTDVVP